MSTASFAEHKAQNSRRRVFYEYPNGAATLTGLLSLMDTDETSQPEFSWFEDRYQNQRTELAAISGSFGAFSTSGGDVGLTAAGFDLAAQTPPDRSAEHGRPETVKDRQGVHIPTSQLVKRFDSDR